MRYGTVTRPPVRVSALGGKPVTFRRALTGEQFSRRMDFAPKSLDAEAGTVEAIFATETPVERYYGTETLRVSKDAVDLSLLIGAPLLDGHNTGSIRDIVGRVESVRVSGRKLVGTIRFDEGAEGQDAKRKVAQGMIRSVSIGYRILKYEDVARKSGIEIDVTATRWRPHEVSLVAVPADPNAKIRSMENIGMDPEDDIDSIDDNEKTEETRTRSRPSPAAQRTSRQIAELRDRAISSGLSEIDVENMLDGVRSISVATERVFDALAEKSRSIRTDNYSGFRGRVNESRIDTRACVVDALAIRLGATPTISDNPLAHQSMLGIARRLMEDEGVATRDLSDRQISEFALGETRSGVTLVSRSSFVERGMHTTSDFPSLLEDASQRALMERFGAQRTPLKTLSTKRNASTFRQQSFIRPGEAPKLEKVGEHGEVTHGTLNEEKQGLTLETYARIFGLTRKAIINDDLGAFADFIRAFAESAATTEGDLFFDLLKANTFGGAKLSDGKNWFHADHGNLATAGGAIGVPTLSTARQAMQLQKNVNGTGRAGAVPAVILVGPARQTEAETVVASLTPAEIDQVNPFAGKLRVEVETRYEGNGWWLFADPQSRPALMHGYLDGMEGPQVETKEGWEVLGKGFRCVLDFGCGVYDWRAAYFNPGT